jgi:hypothetical protein
VVYGVDVDALAATVRACHAVSDLAAGRPGSPATYLAGRRVVGIAVYETEVRIQVRSRWGTPMQEVAAEVENAARPLVGDRTIEVIIADIEDPPGWPLSGDRPAPKHTSRPAGPDAPAAPAPPDRVIGAPGVGHPPAN